VRSLIRLLVFGLRGNELRVGLAQIFSAGALAGVVIEAILKELQSGSAFLNDLGPGLGPDRHSVITSGVDLSILRLNERYAELGEVGFIGYARIGGFATDAGTHPIVNLTMHA